MAQKHRIISALLLLLLSLFASFSPIGHPLLAVNEAQWAPVNIPAEGTAGRWVLASGSDIRHLTMATDGALYCYVNPSTSPYKLFKSADGGRSWLPTGQVTDAITDIATLPQDAATVYYATISCVYKSVDAGNTFTPISSIPGGAGSDNVQITSIDAVRTNNGNIIAVSTIDTDSAQYGGVYLMDESQAVSVWADTDIGAYDVYRIVFSPNYNSDYQLVALASDETDTYITSRISDGNWGQTIGNVGIPGIVPASAIITFPDNYNGTVDNAVFLAGIACGANSGDVYKITCAPAPGLSTTTDLNIGSIDGASGVDVTSLAISGNSMLAGCARNAQIYLSNDDGVSWTRCTKPPTGQTDTCVLFTPNFVYERKAYAVTCGTESALSCSNDGGISWNQISLIDTKISAIPDLAIPSEFTIFMLTHNADNLKHSLWRTSDGGNLWERIFCGSFTGINNLSMVKTIPQYSSITPTILLAGQKEGNPTIWKSNDNGQTFSLCAVPCAIDAWGIADANIWFIGGYDGSKGLVYRTTCGGNSYEAIADVGSQPLTTVILSPNYAQDKTILAGNTTGQIYLSDNNGTNYRLLGQQLPLFADIGNVNLAFDSQFSTNGIIYATTDAKVTSTSKERLFRFVLGQSSRWESIYGSLPDNAILKQVAVANDGTLYAVNTQAVVTADKKGGIIRSLNPNHSAPTFETALSGLEDTVTLNKLSVYNNQIWAVDTKNMRLMTFVDSLLAPVTLTSPTNKSQALNPSNLNLQWLILPGATEYEWEASDNYSFSNLPAGLRGTTDSASARPTGLSTGAKYYWHVRVSKPFLSRWSDTWTFTTNLAKAPELTLPRAGAKTSLKPIFQWGIVAGASKYDLQVAKDALFRDIVIDKTGDNAWTANVWQSDIELENAITYYWRVKARSADSSSNWSAVNFFVTEPATVSKTTSLSETTPVLETEIPTEEPPPSESPPSESLTPQIQSPPETSTTPSSEPVTGYVKIPIWAIYSGIGLLGVITITLVILLIVIIRQQRS